MKKIRLKVALPVVLAAVIFLAGTGHAQPYRPASPFYFGIFGGYVAPEDMTWTSTVTGASADLALDESGMMGLKFGYILPQARALAFELGPAMPNPFTAARAALRSSRVCALFGPIRSRIIRAPS